MLIIDSQIHVWLAESPERPFRQGLHAHRETPIMYEEMRERMDEAGIDRAIIVPPSWDNDRLDHAQEAIEKYPGRFAIMGRLPLEDPDSKKRILHWLDQKGVLGIRLTFHRPMMRAAFTDGTADWFWPEAERLGIPVMLHAPFNLPDVGDIAKRHPRLKLILDHLGVNIQCVDEKLGTGIDNTLTLAKYPNVYVKLSGAPDYTTDVYPFRNIHPYLQRLIEGFGPRRCFWGTDISRLPKTVTYRQCVTMFTEEMPFLSEQDKEWLMGRALAECLGWPI